MLPCLLAGALWWGDIPPRARAWGAPLPAEERPRLRRALRFGTPSTRYRALEWFIRRGTLERDRRALWVLWRRAPSSGTRVRLMAALAAWSPPGELLVLASRWPESSPRTPWLLRALASSPGAAPFQTLLAMEACHGTWRAACVEALRWRLPGDLPRWLRILRGAGRPTEQRALLREALEATSLPPFLAAARKGKGPSRGKTHRMRDVASSASSSPSDEAQSDSFLESWGPPPASWPQRCELWSERFGRCPTRAEAPLPPSYDVAARADRLALAAACAHRRAPGELSRWRAHILEALGDPEPLMRATAAWAVGRLGWRAARPWLLEALWDESLWVRFAAARSLSQWPLRPREAAAVRARWILEPSVRVREALRDVLRGEGPRPGALGSWLHWRREKGPPPVPGAWRQVLWPDGRIGWIAPRCRLPSGVPSSRFAPARLGWRWRPGVEDALVAL